MNDLLRTSPRRRQNAMLPTVLMVIVAMLAVLPGSTVQAAPTATFNVNTTNDTHAVNLSTGVDGSGNISLRSAIEAANSQSGPQTINLPSSTYNLTLGELLIGDSAGDNLSIVGSGTPANTIINAAAGFRVFNVDNNLAGVTFSVSNVSIKNGTDAGFGGGAIIAGGPDDAHPDAVTVTNCVLDSNGTTGGTNGGAVSWQGAGTLNIQNSTISNNSAPGGDGGGAYIDNLGNGVAVTINNTTFSGNFAGPASGAAQGGGLFLTIGTNTATLTNVTFTNNQARTLNAANVGQGGGIYLAAGHLNVSAPSFTGNAATVSGGGTGLGGAFYAAGGVLVITNGTLNGAGGAGELIALNNSAAATVRGAALQNATTIFRNLGSATFTAYANNISGYTTAFVGTGTPAIGHNYWGTNDPAAAAPTGMPGAEWPKRLGAPVNTWADGTAPGGASLGSASLTGGTAGTLVVVSHGRGALSNVPFGNGTAPYATQTCSDYYDFFTLSGSGTFTARVPVDNNANCNANTLTPKKVFWAANLANCSSSTPNTQCWNLISSGTSVASQAIQITGLTNANLGGTPFVAGDPTGLDPTAVTLMNLQAVATPGVTTGWVALLAFVVVGLSALIWALRRHAGA